MSETAGMTFEEVEASAPKVVRLDSLEPGATFHIAGEVGALKMGTGKREEAPWMLIDKSASNMTGETKERVLVRLSDGFWRMSFQGTPVHPVACRTEWRRL